MWKCASEASNVYFFRLFIDDFWPFLSIEVKTDHQNWPFYLVNIKGFQVCSAWSSRHKKGQKFRIRRRKNVFSYLNTSCISFVVWGCCSLDNLHEIIVGMSGKCIAACVKAQRGSSRQPKVKVHISGLHLVKLNVPIPVSWDTLAQSIFGTQFNLATIQNNK